MKDAAGTIRHVITTMEACGVIGQEASDKRDAARRALQQEGISSYTDNTGFYYFNLKETHSVQVLGEGLVACPDCTGDRLLDPFDTCRTCNGRKQVRPRMLLHISGFILNPQQDWKITGFISVGGFPVIGSRPAEVAGT